MAEEQTFLKRLNNSYYKLSKSHLVTRGDVSEGSVKFFEERLNEALPRDDIERSQTRIIKDLYHNAPQLTYKVIIAERDGMCKQASYVLWTNAWCITRHFNVEKLIRLEWNQKENLYRVHALAVAQDESPPDQAPKIVKKPYQTPRQEKEGNWQRVEKKPRKGRRNDRRVRKPLETPSIPEEPHAPSNEPVLTPAIANYQEDIDRANAANEPWA